jgi:hypothetical protein
MEDEMTSAALRPVTRRRDPDFVVVTLRLPLPELTLLYGLASAAHPFGTRVTGTAAAGEEDTAALLLHQATCRLYVALYETSVRGGL